MTALKHSKRIKPDPELVKLTDNLLAQYQTPEEMVGGVDACSSS